MAEGQAAAHVLGVSWRVNLGLPDGGLALVPDERILILRVLRRHPEGDSRRTLVAELFGSSRNLILLDAEGRVLALLREAGKNRPSLRAGNRYEPPAARSAKPDAGSPPFAFLPAEDGAATGQAGWIPETGPPASDPHNVRVEPARLFRGIASRDVTVELVKAPGLAVTVEELFIYRGSQVRSSGVLPAGGTTEEDLFVGLSEVQRVLVAFEHLERDEGLQRYAVRIREG